MDKVLFFEKDGKEYIKYRERVGRLNDKNLEILRKVLKLPYEFLFYGVKKDTIANVMFDMYNKDAESELVEYPYDKKNKKTKYAAIYKEKEQEKVNDR